MKFITACSAVVTASLFACSTAALHPMESELVLPPQHEPEDNSNITLSTASSLVPRKLFCESGRLDWNGNITMKANKGLSTFNISAQWPLSGDDDESYLSERYLAHRPNKDSPIPAVIEYPSKNSSDHKSYCIDSDTWKACVNFTHVCNGKKVSDGPDESKWLNDMLEDLVDNLSGGRTYDEIEPPNSSGTVWVPKNLLALLVVVILALW